MINDALKSSPLPLPHFPISHFPFSRRAFVSVNCRQSAVITSFQSDFLDDGPWLWLCTMLNPFSFAPLHN